MIKPKVKRIYHMKIIYVTIYTKSEKKNVLQISCERPRFTNLCIQKVHFAIRLDVIEHLIYLTYQKCL